MDDRHDNQSHFTHAFSTPLTAMRGAIDLLRNPKRIANDPISRELLDTIERNSARLRQIIEVLLAHSQIRGDMVEIAVPLASLLGTAESPERRSPAPALPEPAASLATADPTPPGDTQRSVL